MVIPAFSSLWAHYPHGDSASVKRQIGGNVNLAWVTNTCVIRISRAFNKAGTPIPRNVPGLNTIRGGELDVLSRHGVSRTACSASLLTYHSRSLNNEFQEPRTSYGSPAERGVSNRAVSYQLSAISYQLSAVSRQPSAVS